MFNCCTGWTTYHEINYLSYSNNHLSIKLRIHGYVRNRSRLRQRSVKHSSRSMFPLWNPRPLIPWKVDAQQADHKPATYINPVSINGADIQNKWRRKRGGGGERSRIAELPEQKANHQMMRMIHRDSIRYYRALRRSREELLAARWGGQQVCDQRQMAAISFSVACVAINCSW